MSKLRLAFLVLLTACGTESAGEPASLEDARFPTGSSALAASPDYATLLTANPETGVVSSAGVHSGSVREHVLGGIPTRIARAGDLYFVSLRGERRLAVLDADLMEIDSIATGNEPYGVVANEAGSRVYVASAMSNRVDEIDVGSLSVSRSYPVASQPRWLALHPNDSVLYVGSAMGGVLTMIDLATSEITSLALPARAQARRDAALGRNVNVPFATRITGDLSIAPDGKDLYVPALYVDNTTGVVSNDDTMNDFPSGGGGGYASTTSEEQRFNPAVVEVPLDAAGKPREGLGSPVNAAVGELFMGERRSGHVSSARVSPDGLTIYATMESADTVAVISRAPLSIGSQELADDRARGLLLETRKRVGIVTNSGPRALAFTDESLVWVLSGFDHRLGGFAGAPFAGSVSGVTMLGGEMRGDISGNGLAISSDDASDSVKLGRRLFFSSMDGRMALPGAGVSCGTCHFEGRNDGLTWPLADGPRQTPLLAGGASQRQPVTWTGNVATVSMEAMLTSQNRMGGFGLMPEEASAVAAFIESVPAPDTPWRGSDDPRIAEGKSLFENEAGCGECHTGPALTDHEMHGLYGLDAVRTRSLVGVAATAPFLHDGSAPTLHDLIGNLRGMGRVGRLSVEQRQALELYLESL